MRLARRKPTISPSPTTRQVQTSTRRAVCCVDRQTKTHLLFTKLQSSFLINGTHQTAEKTFLRMPRSDSTLPACPSGQVDMHEQGVFTGTPCGHGLAVWQSCRHSHQRYLAVKKRTGCVRVCQAAWPALFAGCSHWPALRAGVLRTCASRRLILHWLD
ncbi:hypothetical protein BC567DRAFT_232116 [Phyllosticta citribraziliensis]